MKSLQASLRTCGCYLSLAAAMASVTVPTSAYAHGSRNNNHGNHGNSNQSHKDDYYPSPTNRYMDKRVTICDQGSFFVGGALKPTYFASSNDKSGRSAHQDGPCDLEKRPPSGGRFFVCLSRVGALKRRSWWVNSRR